jgi:general secretion pathway protein J
MIACDRAAAGFTLLELLVVTGLLALLSVLVFGGVRFGSLSWAHAERRRLDTADMTAVMSVLREAIDRAYPEFATRALNDRTVAFEGSPDVLALIAPLPAAIEAGVLARETFFVAPDTAGRPALFMGWRLDLPAADDGTLPPEHRVMLIDHVRHVMFRYFGPVTPGRPVDWLDRWSGRDRLPDLVRVHIERDGPASQPWPDLIAEPKATTNVACVYDTVSPQCRRIQ